MTPLFADTFYWIALADFSDGAHQRALALTAELAVRAPSLAKSFDGGSRRPQGESAELKPNIAA
jgi:hypothetical protein